ncbi:MAG: hypothetical protein ABIV25_06300 [Paracoccaceae bacterium]
MSHEWIFEVLKDLTAYARANGLPALAVKVEEALQVAEVEVADAIRKAGGGGPTGTAH